MEVSGDPLLSSRERWKFRRSSSGLGRTEGGCGRYFRCRVTYYRTGRTLRILVVRLSRGGSRGAEDARGFAKGASLTLRIFFRRLRRVRETLRGPFLFFSMIARVRVRANIFTTSYTRTDTMPSDGVRFSSARCKRIRMTETHVSFYGKVFLIAMN